MGSNYLLEEGRPGKEAVWGRNQEEFLRRFSPSSTEGQGPERLKNLYFLYLLELRALNKAAPVLRQIQFKSDEASEDGRTLENFEAFLSKVESFSDHFDEGVMFQSGEGGATGELQGELQEHLAADGLPRLRAVQGVGQAADHRDRNRLEDHHIGSCNLKPCQARGGCACQRVWKNFYIN